MANISNIFTKLKNKKYDKIINFIDSHPNEDYNIKDEHDIFLLSHVISLHNLEILTKLLKHPLRLDYIDEDGKSILYNPIKFGHLDIIKLLLSKDKDIIGIPIYDITDADGMIALCYAIMFKNFDIINLLLPISNLSIVNKQKNSVLHLAVATKDVEIVKLILSQVTNVNIQNNNGTTPLHIACLSKSSEIVNLLIQNKADINIQEFVSQTYPLHISCFSGDAKITQILVKNGAQVNIQDNVGNTPLHYCVVQNYPNILSILLDVPDADVNIYNTSLVLPLHLCFEKKDNQDLFMNLLLKKSNLNFQDKYGFSVLHNICIYALWKSYIEILKTKKLDITLINEEGKRPIDYVNEKDKKQFLDLVTESYIYKLLNKKSDWGTKWENDCAIDEKTCRINIIKKLNKIMKSKTHHCQERSYPVKTKSSKCLDFPIDRRTELVTFTGFAIDIICSFHYLVTKYDSLMALLHVDKDDTTLCKFAESFNIRIPDCILSSLFITWFKDILFINSNLVQYISQYLKSSSKYALFFISIRNPKVSHANILLHSKDTNEIERFDPEGTAVHYLYKGDLLDEKLKQYFEKVIPEVKYISPSQYLTKVAFQNIELNEQLNNYIGDPIGFCVVWSTWYVDMRLSYPSLTRKKLMKFIFEQMNEKHMRYRSVIRNYSSRIVKIRDEIFKKAHTDINAYANDELDKEQNDIIIKELSKLRLLSND